MIAFVWIVAELTGLAKFIRDSMRDEVQPTAFDSEGQVSERAAVSSQRLAHTTLVSKREVPPILADHLTSGQSLHVDRNHVETDATQSPRPDEDGTVSISSRSDVSMPHSPWSDAALGLPLTLTYRDDESRESLSDVTSSVSLCSGEGTSSVSLSSGVASSLTMVSFLSTVPWSDGEDEPQDLSAGLLDALGARHNFEVLTSDMDLPVVLGRGTFATVFKGIHEGQDVAIRLAAKTSDLENLIVQDIRHHCIVRADLVFRDVSGWQGQVMEEAVGTLLHYIHAQAETGVCDFTKQYIVASLVAAVSHLHSHGILHLDVKCENILVMRNGLLKLTDFGCARRVKPGQSLSQFPVGTEIYKAPEIAEQSAYNKTADWFSSGVTAYKLVKGRYPWKDTLDQLAKLTNGQVDYNGFTESERQLVEGLLVDAPGKRLANLEDITTLPFFDTFDWSALDNGTLPPPKDLVDYCTKIILCNMW